MDMADFFICLGALVILLTQHNGCDVTLWFNREVICYFCCKSWLLFNCCFFQRASAPPHCSPISEMTCNVSSGTLNPTHSLTHSEVEMSYLWPNPTTRWTMENTIELQTIVRLVAILTVTTSRNVFTFSRTVIHSQASHHESFFLCEFMTSLRLPMKLRMYDTAGHWFLSATLRCGQ